LRRVSPIQWPTPTCASSIADGWFGRYRKQNPPGEAATKDLYHLPPEEDALVPTVCHSLDQALEYLDKDRAFLTKGGVFTDSMIDAYIELKMQEVTRFRMATVRWNSTYYSL
jgi:glutamine synthetase